MTSEPWASDRDVLISKVKYGELTPQQAELDAGRLGLEPFEFSPNPPDFDPMTETTWSLVMALAWIIWRTPATVREMWDHYRQEFRFWMQTSWQVPGGPIHEGHFLETKGPAGLRDLDALTVEVSPPNWPGIRDPKQAFRLLSVQAERGVLIATGRPSDGLIARQPILPFEWIDFRLDQANAGDPRPFLAIMLRGKCRIAYGDVRLPVADLCRVFPKDELDANRSSSSSSDKELSPQFKKIQKAIDAELEAGGIVNGLRPKERNKRLCDRMKKQGMKGTEIPDVRTFREFFNRGPGKTEERG